MVRVWRVGRRGQAGLHGGVESSERSGAGRTAQERVPDSGVSKGPVANSPDEGSSSRRRGPSRARERRVIFSRPNALLRSRLVVWRC